MKEKSKKELIQLLKDSEALYKKKDQQVTELHQETKKPKGQVKELKRAISEKENLLKILMMICKTKALFLPVHRNV